jgi:YD repeat-containing protein
LTPTEPSPTAATSKVPDPSLGEPTVTYAYNPNSTRATMVDASGTTTYTYDARNRLLAPIVDPARASFIPETRIDLRARRTSLSPIRSGSPV